MAIPDVEISAAWLFTIWVRLFAKWHWNVYGSKGGEWEG